MLDQTFWTGKRVFLTGHSGFKGGWTVHWLTQMGAQVAGFSLPPDTTPNLFEVTGVAERCAVSHFGDIRDKATLTAALTDFDPDIVLHYGAQPLVRRSYDDPIETFETNVMGTINLLEAVRPLSREVICIVVTSDKCYENPNDGTALSEEAPLGGADPYSASKGACEIAVSSWLRSFFAETNTPIVASVRAGNVIGGGDWADDRLLPDAARAFAKSAPLVIRNPQSTRPWQHVLEPISGYLTLVQKLSGHRSLPRRWNFGPRPADVLPVGAVVDAASDAWQGPTQTAVADTQQDWHEAQTLVLSSALAETQLGWVPRLTTPDAVAWTMQWYQNFYSDPTTARALTLNQIGGYDQLAKSQ